MRSDYGRKKRGVLEFIKACFHKLWLGKFWPVSLFNCCLFNDANNLFKFLFQENSSKITEISMVNQRHLFLADKSCTHAHACTCMLMSCIDRGQVVERFCPQAVDFLCGCRQISGKQTLCKSRTCSRSPVLFVVSFHPALKLQIYCFLTFCQSPT